jgi:hypothetical protein
MVKKNLQKENLYEETLRQMSREQSGAMRKMSGRVLRQWLRVGGISKYNLEDLATMCYSAGFIDAVKVQTEQENKLIND